MIGTDPRGALAVDRVRQAVAVGPYSSGPLIDRHGIVAVRPIIGIAFLLLGIGTWSCRWDKLAADATAVSSDVRWVRTADGWERSDVGRSTVVSPPRLHPLVVALGQGMFSVLALAAFGGVAARAAAGAAEGRSTGFVA